MTFINRDYKRCEEDDFKINVEPFLYEFTCAEPQYVNGKIVGWKIKSMYE